MFCSCLGKQINDEHVWSTHTHARLLYAGTTKVPFKNKMKALWLCLIQMYLCYICFLIFFPTLFSHGKDQRTPATNQTALGKRNFNSTQAMSCRVAAFLPPGGAVYAIPLICASLKNRIQITVCGWHDAGEREKMPTHSLPSPMHSSYAAWSFLLNNSFCINNSSRRFISCIMLHKDTPLWSCGMFCMRVWESLCVVCSLLWFSIKHSM